MNSDTSFLTRSDRFKKLQADFYQNLTAVDRSHLEPRPPHTPVEYVYSRDRDERYLSRSTCSLSIVSDIPGFWYWRPVQIDRTLIDNIQTNGSIEPKLTINRGEFLAR